MVAVENEFAWAIVVSVVEEKIEVEHLTKNQLLLLLLAVLSFEFDQKINSALPLNRRINRNRFG